LNVIEVVLKNGDSEFSECLKGGGFSELIEQARAPQKSVQEKAREVLEMLDWDGEFETPDNGTYPESDEEESENVQQKTPSVDSPLFAGLEQEPEEGEDLFNGLDVDPSPPNEPTKRKAPVKKKEEQQENNSGNYPNLLDSLDDLNLSQDKV